MLYAPPRMPSRPALVPLAAVLGALLVAGCAAESGSQDTSDRFGGQQRLVANTVEDLQSAADDSDEGKICRDLLARALADRLARGASGCQAAVAAVLEDTDANELAVRSVQIGGDTATARVRLETGDRDRTATVRLVRERNGWRIAGF
jgi:hypothetical protein